jgi:hypothetical protein
VPTFESVVTGAEGQKLVLSPHAAPLQAAPEGAAAEGQGHQGVNRINILNHTNINHFLPAFFKFHSNFQARFVSSAEMDGAAVHWQS